MRSFMEMNNYKRCRLWVNDFEYVQFAPQFKNVIKKTISSTMQKSTDIMQIAIEVGLPRNVSNYALIGFDYSPGKPNASTITVSVCVSNESSVYISESLAKPNDQVILGIPEEYAQSILNSAVATLGEMKTFPPGNITFNIGAHSKCGSSKMIFSKATEALMRLWQLDLNSMSDKSLQEIIESLLTSPSNA